MLVETILHDKGARVVSSAPDDSITTVLSTLARHDIGAVVILDDSGEPCGILSERDVIRALDARGAEVLTAPASALMSRDMVTCSPRDSLSDLMAIMTHRRIRHIPVMEGGALCGILSIGDVVKSRVDEIEHEAEALKSYVMRG